MSPAHSEQPKLPAHPLKSIRLENILSFGPKAMELDFKPLNVLIGPNASGKSNLIEVMGLLAATTRDWTTPIRQGGGAAEWVWKGKDSTGRATINVLLEQPSGKNPLRYSLAFLGDSGRPELVEESLDESDPASGRSTRPCSKSTPLKTLVWPVGVEGPAEGLFSNGQPVVVQLRDPVRYPEITYLGQLLQEFWFYRDWNLGRHSSLRRPQRTDLPADFLLEDASNLALVLNGLASRRAKTSIDKQLRIVCDQAEGFVVKVQGGTMQVYLYERDMESPVPPERMSDGTLRYFCLMSILCHPDPPPVICIEEPELGMHPDVLPAIAEMLIDASSRCQLIVTTHSPELVDELGETPESVVVCERTDAGTQMQRLDADRLAKWLQRYRLGELWQKGEIGGTRW